MDGNVNAEQSTPVSSAQSAAVLKDGCAAAAVSIKENSVRNAERKSPLQQKIVYNLPQGTYTVRLSNLRGRYNFDFKIEDGSDTVPSASKIESVTDEKDAV